MSTAAAPTPGETLPVPDRLSWQDASVLAAVAAVQTVLAVLVVTGRLQLGLAVAGHLVCVAILLATVVRTEGRAVAPLAWIAAIAASVLGPFGILGAFYVFAVRRRQAGSDQLLDDWYARISRATWVDDISTLAESIAVGREVRLRGASPRPLVHVMQYGSLSDRQAALGRVARDFDVAYLPALELALQSAEPVVRVQAAAVAARVRIALQSIAAQLGAPVHDTSVAATIARLRTARACARSTLLDASVRATAQRAVDSAERELLDAATSAAVIASALRGPDVGTAAATYAETLISARAWRRLRNWRRCEAHVLAGPYRVRARIRRPRSVP